MTRLEFSAAQATTSPVECPVPGYALRIRGDGALRDWDESICREVLEYDTYRLRQLQALGAQVNCCVDVGGHIGVSTALVKLLWPAARVVVVEPDRTNFRLLKQNSATWPGVSCVQGAVTGAHAGNVPFRSFAATAECGNSGTGRICRDAKTDSVPVRAWTLAELVLRYGLGRVDLLKLDCEGSEGQILEQAGRDRLLETIRWIRGEWHGRTQLEQVLESLLPTHRVEVTGGEHLGLFFGESRG